MIITDSTVLNKTQGEFEAASLIEWARLHRYRPSSTETRLCGLMFDTVYNRHADVAFLVGLAAFAPFRRADSGAEFGVRSGGIRYSADTAGLPPSESRSENAGSSRWRRLVGWWQRRTARWSDIEPGHVAAHLKYVDQMRAYEDAARERWRLGWRPATWLGSATANHHHQGSPPHHRPRRRRVLFFRSGRQFLNKWWPPIYMGLFFAEMSVYLMAEAKPCVDFVSAISALDTAWGREARARLERGKLLGDITLFDPILGRALSGSGGGNHSAHVVVTPVHGDEKADSSGDAGGRGGGDDTRSNPPSATPNPGGVSSLPSEVLSFVETIVSAMANFDGSSSSATTRRPICGRFRTVKAVDAQAVQLLDDDRDASTGSSSSASGGTPEGALGPPASFGHVGSRGHSNGGAVGESAASTTAAAAVGPRGAFRGAPISPRSVVSSSSSTPSSSIGASGEDVRWPSTDFVPATLRVVLERIFLTRIVQSVFHGTLLNVDIVPISQTFTAELSSRFPSSFGRRVDSSTATDGSGDRNAAKERQSPPPAADDTSEERTSAKPSPITLKVDVPGQKILASIRIQTRLFDWHVLHWSRHLQTSSAPSSKKEHDATNQKSVSPSTAAKHHHATKNTNNDRNNNNIVGDDNIVAVHNVRLQLPKLGPPPSRLMEEMGRHWGHAVCSGQGNSTLAQMWWDAHGAWYRWWHPLRAVGSVH